MLPSVGWWCLPFGTCRRRAPRTPPARTAAPHEAPNAASAKGLDAALATRELLAELGLRAFVKTSGNRGVHVFVRTAPRWTVTDVRHAAIAVGRALEKRHDGVTTAWWKEERGAKIFVDFNQNARDRTIASAYSLRPKLGAPVSFPVTWEALPGLDSPRGFHLGTVPDLLRADGDAWAEIDDVAHDLTPLLELWAEDPTEMPYPPDYPKMPGEPKRVQPSRDTDRKRSAD